MKTLLLAFIACQLYILNDSVLRLDNQVFLLRNDTATYVSR